MAINFGKNGLTKLVEKNKKSKSKLKSKSIANTQPMFTGLGKNGLTKLVEKNKKSKFKPKSIANTQPIVTINDQNSYNKNVSNALPLSLQSHGITQHIGTDNSIQKNNTVTNDDIIYKQTPIISPIPEKIPNNNASMTNDDIKINSEHTKIKNQKTYFSLLPLLPLTMQNNYNKQHKSNMMDNVYYILTIILNLWYSFKKYCVMAIYNIFIMIYSYLYKILLDEIIPRYFKEKMFATKKKPSKNDLFNKKN